MQLRNWKIFLDSSVLLAAMGSKTGGSYLVVTTFPCLISTAIAAEVKRHAPKIGLSADQADEWMRKRVSIVSKPSQIEEEKFASVVIDPKDVHVVAAAYFNQVNVLLTLDKKHLLTTKVKKALSPIQVLTPKELLVKL